MNENRVAKDGKEEQADAIEVLLAEVPAMPEHLPRSTQWVERGERKSDPHGIF
jgi:hypothetical protein